MSQVHYVFPSNVLGMCMWLSIPVTYFSSWQLLPSKITMYLTIKFGNIKHWQYIKVFTPTDAQVSYKEY